MLGDGCYLGYPNKIVEKLKLMNDRLNAEVMEQVNDTQELVMLNNFARESNEYQFKKCLQERMSDIASWQWVLDDLNKRLKEAVETLQYEHNAVRVVIERIHCELCACSQACMQLDALKPMCDSVEEALLQERDFLKDQLKKFKNLILELENQIDALEKTRNNIKSDILNKQQTLTIEESCAKISLRSPPSGDRRIVKGKESPVNCWEQRCMSLKHAGLRALTTAIVTRQQVRGARVHLSIAAQSYAARVDSVLRRRLHANKVQIQDLNWQRDEAMRDHRALEEELTATEQNLLETMEQERVIGARLADRSLRPSGELTRDEVDLKLREELRRLRNFIKQLRKNHCRITTLQEHLTDCITRIDCCIDDIMRIVDKDEETMRHRHGKEPSDAPNSPDAANVSDRNTRRPSTTSDEPLDMIREEDEEEDDYPFKD